jgi:hypothetical protein
VRSWASPEPVLLLLLMMMMMMMMMMEGVMMLLLKTLNLTMQSSCRSSSLTASASVSDEADEFYIGSIH